MAEPLAGQFLASSVFTRDSKRWPGACRSGFGIYGTWQAIRVPDVRTIEITLPRLPVSLDGFSIVQLSDIHLGPFLKGAWLRDVVAKTNALSPDLVAVTGDMIDGSPDELKDDVAPLGDLQARYGVYGITGNHEYYFRVESGCRFLQSWA